MIDVQIIVLLSGAGLVVPEGVAVLGGRVEGAECVDIAFVDDAAESGAALGFVKCVVFPAFGIVEVNFGWTYVVVATEHRDFVV